MIIKKKWLITGISGGLGKELARIVAEKDEQVIGIVRKEEDKILLMKEIPNVKVYLLDLSNLKQVEAVTARIIKENEFIDVVVNNAGYGLFGFLEELNDDEFMQQFVVNFFAPWKIIQQVLPSMREQKSGVIVNVSSRLGLVAGVGNGAYAAAKFALEGMSESLAQEVKAFGIKVLLAEPGPMRTSFFGNSINFAKNSISDYGAENGDIRARSKSLDGTQKGNPREIAKTIYEIVNCDQIPLRLPLTALSIDAFQQKKVEIEQILDNWTDKALSVDF